MDARVRIRTVLLQDVKRRSARARRTWRAGGTMSAAASSPKTEREAVRQASQPAVSVTKVAQDLGLHANLLHRWVRELGVHKDGRVAKADAIVGLGPGEPAPAAWAGEGQDRA